jgi:hypothetical protein
VWSIKFNRYLAVNRANQLSVKHLWIEVFVNPSFCLGISNWFSRDFIHVVVHTRNFSGQKSVWLSITQHIDSRWSNNFSLLRKKLYAELGAQVLWTRLYSCTCKHFRRTLLVSPRAEFNNGWLVPLKSDRACRQKSIKPTGQWYLFLCRYRECVPPLRPLCQWLWSTP